MSKLFWAMLAFISRLPVPSRWSQGLDFEQYSRGIVMFPFIGLILGGVSGLIFILLQPWCGIPLAALFCILALALLTGGFHLDGLADTCDGIFSARRRERMLEIMRDSRLGTHGGLASYFCATGKNSGGQRTGVTWNANVGGVGGGLCGRTRQRRFIDVPSSLRP